MSQSYSDIISKEFNLHLAKVKNTIDLLTQGATIPFISRYRKEATGGMDEVQILDIQNLLSRLVELDKRREAILKSVEEQGKLTSDLRLKIEKVQTLSELEDIYLPFKPKRKTRASVAVEKGLEPLAKMLLSQNERDISLKIPNFINDKVENEEDALQGARDIIAEWVSENSNSRGRVRHLFEKEAVFTSKMVKGKEEEGQKYRDYFGYEEKMSKCPSHRILAMRRGEDEGILRLSIFPPEELALDILERLFVKGNNESARQVKLALKDSWKRLLGPSIETEYRNNLKEKADLEAIKVFAENLRQLLLASPLGQKKVMAIDPGFRSGCKVVCLDAQGNFMKYETVFPHEPQRETLKAADTIKGLAEKYKIEAIAVGNGTAGRETETFVKSLKLPEGVKIFMVNENGASVYSASEVAREEFPDEDVTVRGAVSIGRRLMDPLAELVKIDAKSIGVGQYQHDVDQKLLKESLDRVVESCVNKVGVNVNTASKQLLTYVSGLGPQLAQNIVNYRKENGPLKSRKELMKVARMGEKAFVQCAGFLRIPEAKNPLDASAVHPESYPVVERMAKDLNCKVQDLLTSKELRKQIVPAKYVTETTGLPTLNDILKELEKPGLDPRTEIKAFEFAEGVRKPEDLYVGMVLPGIVTNITNFGAFVDIGVKQDGLVHISQIADKFVENPADVVKLQQQVRVKVIEVDLGRKRISLSMKNS